MLDRRHFLSSAATGLATSLALRGNLFAQLEKTPPLPDHTLLDNNEDVYWAAMRRQFLIPGRRNLSEQRHRRLQPRARAARHL